MLSKELHKHIRKLISPLLSDDELRIVLKARLTKREYKMLMAWSEQESKDEIEKRLKISDDEYEKIASKLIKKLNQEKLKQELTE